MLQQEEEATAYIAYTSQRVVESSLRNRRTQALHGAIMQVLPPYPPTTATLTAATTEIQMEDSKNARISSKNARISSKNLEDLEYNTLRENRQRSTRERARGVIHYNACCRKAHIILES